MFSFLTVHIRPLSIGVRSWVISLPWRQRPASNLKLSLEASPAGATFWSAKRASQRASAFSGATEISNPSSPNKNLVMLITSVSTTSNDSGESEVEFSLKDTHKGFLGQILTNKFLQNIHCLRSLEGNKSPAFHNFIPDILVTEPLSQNLVEVGKVNIGVSSVDNSVASIKSKSTGGLRNWT